ncbi:MAG TPA: flavin reductase family protein [Methanomassiliicoccaceae archaeon]|nr:flavin reductase family protein [Methanomassiliicoccaceae archaeon]
MSEEVLKLDMGPIEAVMSLPPSPVFLLAVGEEEPNVTTIGMFNVFSIDPTIVGVGIRTSRHSYKLLEETGDFSLNIPGKNLVDQVVRCGYSSGSRMNKFSETGMTPQPGKRIRSPSIAECPLNMEVRITEVQDRMDWDHIWIVGKVVHTDVIEGYDRTDVLIYWDGEFRTPSPVLREL